MFLITLITFPINNHGHQVEHGDTRPPSPLLFDENNTNTDINTHIRTATRAPASRNKMRAVLKFLVAAGLSMTAVMAQNCADLTVGLKTKSASVKQRTNSYHLGLVFTNEGASSITISQMSLGIPLGTSFQGAKPTGYRSLSSGSKSTSALVGKNLYKDAFHSCNFANWTDITLPAHMTMQYLMNFAIDYCAAGPLIFTGTIQYGNNCSKTLTPIEVSLTTYDAFSFRRSELCRPYRVSRLTCLHNTTGGCKACSVRLHLQPAGA